MTEIVAADKPGRIEQAVGRISRVLSVIIRFTPHETLTEDGRAKERMRRVALTAMASMLAKGVSVATLLISIPLTIHYLGPERYGMWMVISSFAMLLSFADLGLGNGLLNVISRCNGRDDQAGINSAISNGYFALGAVSLVFLTLFLSSYRFVAWEGLFNVSSPQAIAEARPAIFVYACCFALAIPLALIQRIQAGLQQGFNSSLWQCAASALSLISILAVIHAQGGLPWLVLGLVGAPLAANLGNAIVFFTQRPALIPALSRFSLREIVQIGRTGILFLVLQVVASVAYGSDTIIITQTLGPTAVATYSVPERMFSMISMVLAMALSPLWPAYGEAVARRDHAWVKRIFKRSLVLSVVLAAMGSLFLIVLGRQIINLWVGQAVTPPFALILGLGLWKITESAGTAVATYFNGIGVVKLQIYISLIAGSFITLLKIVTINLIGLAGIPFSAVVAYIVFAFTPSIIFIRRSFSVSHEGKL